MTEAAQQTAKDTQKPKTFTSKAFAAQSDSSPLGPHTIARREPGPQDVQIEILFCGVCHSDLHTVRNEWKSVMPTVYPCVPGHEIVGRVTKVGSSREEIQSGRYRCGGLHGGFGPHLSGLQSGRRAVLHRPGDLHL